MSRNLNAELHEGFDALAAARELDGATRLLMSAVETLRDIAAIKGTSKRQRANSEIAANWLREHGFAVEDGGYIPGVGFEKQQSLIRHALDCKRTASDPSQIELMRRQAE